jgi:hypothetical protein
LQLCQYLLADDNVQPWLRRISPACFACNRIWAFRPVLPCRQNRLGLPRFGLFPKIWLVAFAAELHRLCNLSCNLCDGVFADIWK